MNLWISIIFFTQNCIYLIFTLLCNPANHPHRERTLNEKWKPAIRRIPSISIKTWCRSRRWWCLIKTMNLCPSTQLSMKQKRDEMNDLNWATRLRPCRQKSHKMSMCLKWTENAGKKLRTSLKNDGASGAGDRWVSKKRAARPCQSRETSEAKF